MGNNTQIRQTMTPNGNVFQQPIPSGIMTTPTNIVRVNPSQQTIPNPTAQFVPQTVWTNTISQAPQQQQQFTVQKPIQQPSLLQYATIKNGNNSFLFLIKD